MSECERTPTLTVQLMQANDRNSQPAPHLSKEGTHRIAVVLMPDFPLMAFSNITEPLRAANRLSGRALYQWDCLSLDGEPVSCSSGIALSCTGKVSDSDRYKTVFVCSGLPVSQDSIKPYHHSLWQHANRGSIMGGVSSGSLVLASAGLLNDHQCTIHWEYIVSFSESYPHLDIVDQLFVMDRKRYTCSGGTAAMDMMLAMIADENGNALAAEVASQFIHDRTRSAGEHQRLAEDALNARQSVKMAAAINLMRRNLDEPLAPHEIADRVNLSLRQLERLFKKHKETTPQHYYLAMRLDQARRYVIQTGRALYDIAIAVGFVSQSHFSKCYRERFGMTPMQDRNSTSTN